MLDTIFPFVGGVGLFLVGMMLLSDGLVAFAGGALRRGLIRAAAGLTAAEPRLMQGRAI